METKQEVQKYRIKKVFLPGSEWLYIKLYTGVKTADAILSETILPFSESLLKEKKIHKWFFIRYSDPDTHIRLRFHITNKSFLGSILCCIEQLLSPFMEAKALWGIQVDTYKREVERYTPELMGLAEELFFYDSVCAVRFLSLIEGDGGEEIRWRFALRSVDCLLDNFGFSMENKAMLMLHLSTAFGKEFGMNKSLKVQLDTKFRKLRSNIQEVFLESPKTEDYATLWQLIDKRSESSAICIKGIIEKSKEGRLSVSLDSLTMSYLHMLMNRLFRSGQRKHELVIYYLLHKHYASTLARMAKMDQTKKQGMKGATL